MARLIEYESSPNVPVFVTRNIFNLPPSDMKYIDIATICKDVQEVHHEMGTMQSILTVVNKLSTDVHTIMSKRKHSRVS